MFFNKPKYHIFFEPKEDITAFELAKITPLIIPDRFMNVLHHIKQLPKPCLRHIEVNGKQLTEEILNTLEE